ncbi:MAG: class II aldolase/adducin family protein [Chloroflexi bacterium]|nr:class II aldolase/adducin family protein [Chloroflexota bacterium]
MVTQAPAKDTEEVRRLKETVVTASRILDNEGIYDYVGHVSARTPGAQQMFITPHLRELSFREVTPRDVVTVDFKGNKVAGGLRPPQEIWIHICIYRARPDVNCVVHIHPEYCVAMGVAEEPILPYYVTGNVFIKGVPLFKEPDLILTEALGERLVKTLGDYAAVNMKWHGVSVVGSSIEEACIATIKLEQAARIQALSMAIANGRPIQPLPPTSNTITPEFIHSTAGWKYYLSRL